MSHEQILRDNLAILIEELNYKDSEINVKEISGGGTNYTSVLFKVSIKDKVKDHLHLFSKVACLGEKSRGMVKEWKLYSTEHFVYLELSNIYKSLYDEHGVPEEHRVYFTKCYRSDPTVYKETIILEDLTASGWSSFDRFKPLDWAYASAACTELAKFHALSLVLSAQNPEEFDKIFKKLQATPSDDAMEQFLQGSINSALKYVNPVNRDALQKYAIEYQRKFTKFFGPSKCSVLVHGDYRPSNLMHKEKEIAEEHEFVNYDLNIKPTSSGGANYTTTLFNVTLTERGNVINMFAKVAAMGEKIRQEGPAYYNTEMFMYTKVAKVFDKLQEEHQVPKEHALAFPKFYGCNPTLYEETLVLEDLVVKGYEAYDRFKPIDWEYATAGVTELAKMHALSFAYGEYFPEEYNKIIDDLNYDWNMEEGQKAEYFDKEHERAINSTYDENRDKLIRFVEVYGKKKYTEMYHWSVRPVLSHGDYRPSNLMHKIRDDGTVDIKIVDLQTVQGSSPLVDLLYFIFTGSDEEFRAKYYEKLLDHYYTQLEAAMKRLHLDPEKIYSREDFEYELKEKLPFGLTIALFALPVVTVSAENAPAVNEEMDLSSFSINNTSDLYKERLNGVVNDFVKWGILK